MNPTVTISDGELVGREDNGICRFLGIPFAAPPVGDLRWRPPSPVSPWQGQKDAGEFGCSAPQAPAGGLQKLIGISGGPTSEDCLYLNVWTPAADGARRPVLFWIHGGANTVGSGAQPRINGEHLARRGDVVVVTFNYRLGAFGFLHSPELGASGNEALLDQVAALEWVQKHIEHFGGDPDNVTAFGQSAGGFDLVALMGMAKARGLFHKAGPMSGSLGVPKPVAEAMVTTDALAGHFGGLEKLRGVRAEDVLAWQLSQPYGYGAVADDEYIDAPLADVIGEGRYTRSIPLLIGTCEHEAALWTAMSDKLKSMTPDSLREQVSKLDAGDTDTLVAAYELPGRSPTQTWTAIMTDRMFRLPAIATADLHRTHTPAVWFYLFDYQSPALGGQLGSVHSLDIPFTFGTLTAEGMDEFCGAGPAVNQLSSQVMDMWIAFAVNGSPQHENLPAWPTYGDSRSTMRLGLDTRVEDDPLSAQRKVWGADS